MVALPVTLVAQAAAFAIQFRGMIPFPASIQVAVMLTYAFVFTAPYVGDHFSIRRLSGFSRSLVFPLLWSALEFLVSFGPLGSVSRGVCAYTWNTNALLNLWRLVRLAKRRNSRDHLLLEIARRATVAAN